MVEVRYRNGFGGWRLHPLDKLFGGVGLRDKSTSPFKVIFLFLPVLFCKQEKESKKNKQINKNMGGAV